MLKGLLFLNYFSSVTHVKMFREDNHYLNRILEKPQHVIMHLRKPMILRLLNPTNTYGTIHHCFEKMAFIRELLIPCTVLLIKIRPNKKISMFRVTGLKILGRVGTHFFNYFFSGKMYYFLHFEWRFAFQNA